MGDKKKIKRLAQFLRSNHAYIDPVLFLILLIVIAPLLQLSFESILIYYLGVGMIMAGILYLIFMLALKHRNKMEKTRYYSKSVQAARFTATHIEAISFLFFVLAVIFIVPFEFEHDSGTLLLFAYIGIVHPLLDSMKNSDKRERGSDGP